MELIEKDCGDDEYKESMGTGAQKSPSWLRSVPHQCFRVLDNGILMNPIARRTRLFKEMPCRFIMVKYNGQ